MKIPRRKWVIQMKRIFAVVLCSAVMICTAFAVSVPANPTREIGQEVYVNDTRVYPTAYNISGNNYFKLRDIGKLAGFGVDWDGETQTVELSSQRIPVDLAGISDTSVSGAVAKRSTQRFALDGYYINVTAYLIGGNNYVKLRDIALQINFCVDYDEANRRVDIYPGLFYGEEPNDGADIPNGSTVVTDEMLRAWELEMVDRINEERSKVGVPAVSVDRNLMLRAQKWAEHLTTDFRHSTWSEVEAFADSIGVSAENISGGENIAGGVFLEDNPVEIDMKKFMASEGHRNAILNEEFTRVGVGFAVAADGRNIYCCQHLGR